MTLKTTALLAALVFALPGCGTKFMMPAHPGEILSAPPAGMVLVNVHRPSRYAGKVWYTVFDGTTLIGANKGNQLFQYVCEPGQRTFIGYGDVGWFGTVCCIQADLAADGIYDMVVDTGFFASAVVLMALSKSNPATAKRRPEVATWLSHERGMVILRDNRVAAHEARMRDRNLEIIQDFVHGEKQSRLQVLTPDDTR